MPLAPIALMVLIASPGPGDWRKVTSKEGGFSVTVPGRVEEKTVVENTDDGPVDVRMVVAESDGITFVASASVITTRVTPEKQSAYFDNVREMAAVGPGKVLLKEQRGKFRGMALDYLRYSQVSPDGRTFVLQSRYLVGDPTHLFTLQVVAPKGVDVNAEVKRFFDSFDRARPAGGRAAKGPADPAKWAPFSPPGQGFLVTMPGEPTASRQDPADGSVRVQSYAVDLEDRRYSVVVYDFPASVADREPAAVLDDLARGSPPRWKARASRSSRPKGTGSMVARSPTSSPCRARRRRGSAGPGVPGRDPGLRPPIRRREGDGRARRGPQVPRLVPPGPADRRPGQKTPLIRRRGGFASLPLGPPSARRWPWV